MATPTRPLPVIQPEKRSALDITLVLFGRSRLNPLSRKPSVVGSRLNLRGSAIYEELDTGDVARIVRGEERHGLRDLVFRADAAKRRRGPTPNAATP